MAKQYSDDTSRRITRLRKEQWNIIITAILFGLTLNLVADFINSFVDPSVLPMTILYRGVVALVAFLVTIGVMVFLVIRDFREECVKEREIELTFFFNTDTGEPYSGSYYHPTDRLAMEFERANQKQKTELTKLVNEAYATLDNSKLLPFQELLTIYELTHREVPIDGESERISFMDKVALKQSPIGDYFRAYDFKVPGSFDSDYVYQKSEPKGPLTKGNLTINWKNGYHGKMTIEFEYSQGFIGQHDIDLLRRPSSGHLSVYYLVTNIVLKTEFSPVRLFFRRSNVEVLIEWSNRLYNRMLDTADWRHYIEPYEEAERKSIHSVRLRG